MGEMSNTYTAPTNTKLGMTRDSDVESLGSTASSEGEVAIQNGCVWVSHNPEVDNDQEDHERVKNAHSMLDELIYFDHR